MSQVITGISSIPISAASADYAPTNTADVGDMIGSAVSGLASTADLSAYLATSSICVDSASAITSIAGSSIAGGGATGDYVPTSARTVGIGSNITAVSTAFAQGYKVSANTLSFAQGYNVSANAVSFAQGESDVSARQYSFAQGSSTTAEGNSFAQGRTVNAISCSFAQGFRVSASATAAVFGAYNLDGQGSGTSGIALAFGDGTATTAKHNLFEFRKDGTLTLYSSTADTTGLEVRSALNSKLDTSASSAFITSTADCMPLSASSNYQTTAGMSGYATTGDLSSKLDSSASSAFLTSQVNASWSETASGSPAFIADKPDLVDIVAGPGIVVDNPDGNTLRVSLLEDYEEVLYAASTDAGTTLSVNDYITLSESLTHFEKVKIYYALQKSWGGAVSHEIYKVSGDQRIVLEQLWFREQSGYNNYWQTITYSNYSDTNLTITLVDGSQRSLLQNSWGSTGLTLTVFKVVGIHRTASN